MNDQKLLVALNAILDALDAVTPGDKMEPARKAVEALAAATPGDKMEPARKAVEALQPNPFPFGQGGANA